MYLYLVCMFPRLSQGSVASGKQKGTAEHQFSSLLASQLYYSHFPINGFSSR